MAVKHMLLMLTNAHLRLLNDCTIMRMVFFTAADPFTFNVKDKVCHANRCAPALVFQ